MATPTKTARTIVSNQSQAAGGTTRGTLDQRTTFGGTLTAKIVNGATGPTVQCVFRLMYAHNDGATPAAAAEGTDWKRVIEIGGGTTANATTRISYEIPIGVQHTQVEFTGNTGQAVTIEAFMSEISSIS